MLLILWKVFLPINVICKRRIQFQHPSQSFICKKTRIKFSLKTRIKTGMIWDLLSINCSSRHIECILCGPAKKVSIEIRIVLAESLKKLIKSSIFFKSFQVFKFLTYPSFCFCWRLRRTFPQKHLVFLRREELRKTFLAIPNKLVLANVIFLSIWSF